MAKAFSVACRMLLRPSMPRCSGARSGGAPSSSISQMFSPPISWPRWAGAAAGTTPCSSPFRVSLPRQARAGVGSDAPPSPPPCDVSSPRQAGAGAGSGAPPSPPGASCGLHCLLARNHGEIHTIQVEDSCCKTDSQNLGQEASMLNYLKSVITVLTGQHFLRRFVSAAQVRDEDMLQDMNIPIVDLDLLTLSSGTFDAAMRQIAALYDARAGDGPANRCKGIACTTEEEGWHVVRLTNGPNSPSLLLIIDQKNNYIVGFRRQDGSWWHFSCFRVPKQLNASPLLHISGSYMSLLGHQSWKNLRLGWGELYESYFVLLKYKENVSSSSQLRAQTMALARIFCNDM